jgi:hypothetical protein
MIDRKALSAAYCNPEYAAEIAADFSKAWRKSARHGMIYKAILDLVETGQAVDTGKRRHGMIIWSSRERMQQIGELK